MSSCAAMRNEARRAGRRRQCRCRSCRPRSERRAAHPRRQKLGPSLAGPSPPHPIGAPLPPMPCISIPMAPAGTPDPWVWCRGLGSGRQRPHTAGAVGVLGGYEQHRRAHRHPPRPAGGAARAQGGDLTRTRRMPSACCRELEGQSQPGAGGPPARPPARVSRRSLRQGSRPRRRARRTKRCDNPRRHHQRAQVKQQTEEEAPGAAASESARAMPSAENHRLTASPALTGGAGRHTVRMALLLGVPGWSLGAPPIAKMRRSPRRLQMLLVAAWRRAVPAKPTNKPPSPAAVPPPRSIWPRPAPGGHKCCRQRPSDRVITLVVTSRIHNNLEACGLHVGAARGCGGWRRWCAAAAPAHDAGRCATAMSRWRPTSCRSCARKRTFWRTPGRKLGAVTMLQPEDLRSARRLRARRAAAPGEQRQRPAGRQRSRTKCCARSVASRSASGLADRRVTPAGVQVNDPIAAAQAGMQRRGRKGRRAGGAYRDAARCSAADCPQAPQAPHRRRPRS